MIGGTFTTNFVTYVPHDVAGGASSPIQLSEVALQPIQLSEVGLQTGGFELPAQNAPLYFPPTPRPPHSRTTLPPHPHHHQSILTAVYGSKYSLF